MTNKFDFGVFYSGAKFMVDNHNQYYINWAVPFVIFVFVLTVRFFVSIRNIEIASRKKQKLSEVAEKKISLEQQKLKNRLSNGLS